MTLCPGTWLMLCGWKQSHPRVFFLTGNHAFAALHGPVSLQGVWSGRRTEAQLKL